MNRSVLEPFAPLGGEVGFYYKNLVTGDSLEQNGDMPLEAASVIKLTVMAEAFSQFASGEFCRDELFVVRPEDKLPSCGALNELHDYANVTGIDLVRLMIVFSDNSATNMLIKRLGMERINALIDRLGLEGTRLNRCLYDDEASERGVENYISARGMGRLLELIYRGELVSHEASREMLDILFDQKLTGKLPLPLPRDIEVAHKTGEDDGITHDVGIVAASEPYIICVCANKVYAPAFDRAIHEVSLRVFDSVDGK